MPSLGTPLQIPPRAIIFDIGRVIIGIDVARSFDILGEHTGLSADQVSRAVEASPYWSAWQEGRMAPHEYHMHFCKQFSCSIGFEQFRKAWNRMLEPVTILPESLFERLASNCRLALLSNTDPIHVEYIEATYPFVRHFPARVYSCGVGASKPAAAIYQHALDELDVSPDEALFIDDMYANVSAAVRLGINSFHFVSTGELLAELCRFGLVSPQHALATHPENSINK